jgi:zinc transporter 1/2/3
LQASNDIHNTNMDITHFATLVLRQDQPASPVGSAAAESANACEENNDYDGRIGLRISAIFVILVGSMLGMFHLVS